MNERGSTTGTFTPAELGKLAAGSLRSARRIVPLIINLVRPNSVIDVGCGLGSWLSVFRQYGIEDFVGVDGPELERAGLAIPAHRFRSHDLSKPLELDRGFDLVVCLEVAEHLPLEAGPGLVESLTRLGPVVLFSAAVPGQGGSGHVNEQWPDYWAGYFDQRGYRPVDCIREVIWDDGDVEFWYRQNTFLYVDSRELDRLGSVFAARCPTGHGGVRRLVHPLLYEKARWLHRAEGAARELLGLLLAYDLREKRRPDTPAMILLLDEAKLDLGLPAGCGWELVTFPQRDGQFSGPPPNDHAAVAELEQWRARGAGLLVIAWPAYWWLDFYPAFAARLGRRYPRRVETANLQVFDLRIDQGRRD